MSSSFPAALGLAPGARVLIAGGTGVIGSGIVQAMLKQGANVVVASRSTNRFNQLWSTIPWHHRPQLSTILGNVLTEEGVQDVYNKVTSHQKGVQHVVAAIKGDSALLKGDELMDQSIEDVYTLCREADLTGHFLLMKSFIPYLSNFTGTSYTLITGHPDPSIKSLQPKYETAASSLHCLTEGVISGLGEAAREGTRRKKVAVNEINIKCQVHPWPDKTVYHMGPEHVGHDLMGTGITAVVAKCLRTKVVVNNRSDIKRIANISNPRVYSEQTQPTPDL